MKKSIYYSLIALFMLVLGGLTTACSNDEPELNGYTISMADLSVSAPNFDWMKDVAKIEEAIKAEFGDSFFTMTGKADECDATAIKRFNALMDKQKFTAKFNGVIKFTLSSKKGVIAEREFTNPIAE